MALISTTAFAYSVAHPQDGIYSIQPKCAPGKELSVQNHDRNWGANVIIDNINSGWQKWKIQRIAGTDFYSIIAVHSGLAVDVANATAQNGINIATWPYLGGSQNQFRIWDAGNNYFVIQGNLNSGDTFVMDVVNAENRAGANVWSYGFNGSDAQLWRLEMQQSLSAFQPYNKTASRKVTAYVMPDLHATAGNEYVSAGDNVTVLREEGNAIFVRYPIRNGTKERWVNKNEIFGGNTNPSPNNNSNGLLSPIKPNITVTSISASTNGFKCDYVTNGEIPVYAPANGKVSFRQSYATRYNKLASYGNNIRFYSADGQYEIRLCHLSRFVGCRKPLQFTQTLEFPCGQTNSSYGPFDTVPIDTIDVNQGDLIGYTGMTGNAKGHHIHIEVYKNGRAVNPKSVFNAW